MAFDFKKEYKEFYMPKSRPEIIIVPKMNYIAVRGSASSRNIYFRPEQDHSRKAENGYPTPDKICRKIKERVSFTRI